jgi:hypothetical protein
VSSSEENGETGTNDGEEVTVEGEDLDSLPEVGLEWLCDEDDGCQELTVFDPSAEDATTTWLSVDADAAIPLEEAR